jgi:uroporphyrinogen-III synthase
MTPPLLLTRPEPAAWRFAEAWRVRRGSDAPVVIAPVTEIVPLASGAPLPEEFEAVFTSENAVAALGEGRGRRAWCVGAATAEAAAAAGYAARSAGGAASDLVAALLAARPKALLLHARGREGRGDVAARLRENGLSAEERVVYAQVPRPLSAEARRLLAAPGPVLVPLFSANSAKRLSAALAGEAVAAELLAVAISQAAAAAWPGPSALARSPDAEAMLDALEARARAP